MAVSKIRQNYHEDCEALINKQINMEFYASYVYLSMVSRNMTLYIKDKITKCYHCLSHCPNKLKDLTQGTK